MAAVATIPACSFWQGAPEKRGWQHETKQKLPVGGPLTLDTAGQELAGGPRLRRRDIPTTGPAAGPSLASNFQSGTRRRRARASLCGGSGASAAVWSLWLPGRQGCGLALLLLRGRVWQVVRLARDRGGRLCLRPHNGRIPTIRVRFPRWARPSAFHSALFFQALSWADWQRRDQVPSSVHSRQAKPLPPHCAPPVAGSMLSRWRVERVWCWCRFQAQTS